MGVTIAVIISFMPASAPCDEELCEFPEVLGGGRQVELVAGTIRPSQSQTVELQDALQVRKEHFDLLALTPRGLAFFGRQDVC
jgi:hypothetical protein